MSSLWVFGYGSLCWNPGFKYSDAHVGYIKDFKRRFWQGNDSHRGTPDKLGRVVTLIQQKYEVTWGKAFQLDDEVASKNYLDNRETQLGGYSTIIATFYPYDKNVKPFPVLIYIALPENKQYLGKASNIEIAMNIISCKGNSGHNVEYLAKLAKFMKQNLPKIEDDHLYLLEQTCIKILQKFNSPLLDFFLKNTIDKKWISLVDQEINKNDLYLNNIKSLDELSDLDSYKENINLKNLEKKNDFSYLEKEIERHNQLIEKPISNQSQEFLSSDSSKNNQPKKLHFTDIVSSRKSQCIKI